ncbi:MAG: hypothetical protein KAT09_00030 [Candidatus Aegiribacteria sp.]|nr:hypothetical protein [Candidatus Aegiribacteria sp.]
MLILLSALMLSTGSEYDYSRVVMTTYPEGYIPETMEEWQTTQFLPVPLIVNTFLKTGSESDETSFLVIFENGLAPAVGSALIEQWATDISCNGLTVEVVEVTYSTPEELKNYLVDCHDHGLEGAVLVGDLPVAWSMIDNEFIDSSEEFPSDYFFMDLNGSWQDLWIGYPSQGTPGQDGKYDTWSGELDPEIYIGRILTSNLGDEVSLITSYLNQNHSWRDEGDTEPLQALCYVDDDWAYWGLDFQQDMQLLYPNTDLVNDNEVTTDSDYENIRLPASYSWISPFVHSCPYYHLWYTGMYPTYNYEVVAIQPPAHFYNLFACSNCRFTTSDYMGGSYVFLNTNGLAAVGSTKSGAMLRFGFFYEPMGNDGSIGEGFSDWWNQITSNGFTGSERSWHLGMTLLGDPTLVPSMAFVSVPEDENPLSESVFISVVSNPCCGTAIFHTGNMGESLLSIWDISGRLIDEMICNSEEFLLDVSTYSTGIYLVELLPVDGAARSCTMFTVLH